MSVVDEVTKAYTNGDRGDGARRATEQVAEALKSGLEAGEHKLHQFVDQAGASIKDAHKEFNKQVQERPITAAAAALSVGVVIGMLLSRRS